MLALTFSFVIIAFILGVAELKDDLNKEGQFCLASSVAIGKSTT